MLSKGGSVEALCQNDYTSEFDARYLPAGAGTFRGFGGSRTAFASAALLAAGRGPDWIILGHAQYLPLAPLLRAITRRRVACVLLGVEAWARWKPLQRLGQHACTEFISISDYTRRQNQQVNHTGGIPTHLLPCSLDPFWVPSAIPPTRSAGAKLLTVARLSSRERYKGVDDLFQALPQIRQAYPDLRCRIVGDGSDRPRLENLARELGVNDNVVFLGAVGSDDLRHEYATCDLFVMPSALEGFGIVFLEAASCAKPSIGAAAGGAPEVIRDGLTGVLVTPRNAAVLAGTILRLLGSPERLRAMGEAALADMGTRFSYSTFQRRFADLVLSPPPSGAKAFAMDRDTH